MSARDFAAAPQDIVENALSLARPADCLVIAENSSIANLRWADNTLTTNGVMDSRSLTVIIIDRRPDGTAGVGVITRAGVRQDQVEEVVREAERAAGQAMPAEDATALLATDSPAAGNHALAQQYPEVLGWNDPPEKTGIRGNDA